MDDIEIRAKARELIVKYPKGIRAGELMDHVGPEDFNAVLRELMALAQKRRHGGCENCGHCDCEL